jgi:hypothetical protein
MNCDENPELQPLASEDEVAKVIGDFQTKTLAEMPGRFNKLVYLASLRDYNTGRYHHYGLETRYSAAAVDQGLHRCHIQIFEELVTLPLEEQTRDLVAMFESVREDRKRLIETWRKLRSYQVLPPADCHHLARQLFDKNIEVMLRILRETDLWALLYEPHGDSDNLP